MYCNLGKGAHYHYRQHCFTGICAFCGLLQWITATHALSKVQILQQTRNIYA